MGKCPFQIVCSEIFRTFVKTLKRQPAPFRVPGLKLYCYHYISIKKGGDKNATCNPQLAIDFPNKENLCVKNILDITYILKFFLTFVETLEIHFGHFL